MAKRKLSRTVRKEEDHGIISETSIAQEKANVRIDQLIELTYGSLKTYTERFTWRNVNEAIAIAMGYARGGSEMIQTGIAAKVEFFGAGFKIKINSGREALNGALNQRIADWMQTHDVRQLCDDLMFDLLAADNCVLQWQVNKQTNEIDYITTLPPDTVECLPGNLDTRLGIRMSEQLKAEVLKSIKDKKQKQFSPKIVQAVKDGTPVIWFDEADGEFWILKSRGPKFSGLRQPSMRSIFADIQLRELLISGDWSTAYFTKNFVTLVTMGESIKQGPRAGTRDLYPDFKEIQAVQAQFKKIGTTLRLYGNHTLNVRHVYPDQNVLGNTKYEGVEKRITRWLRVPDVMLTGQGDGYSQGSLALKSFQAQGERVREIISEMFMELMTHESVMDDPNLNLPTRSIISVTFNKQMLKESADLLAELTWLNGAGMMDVETAHDTLGYDYMEIKDRKERDAGDGPDLWKPVFEASQGLLNKPDDGTDDKGGPPSKKPGGKDPAGPRPSRNE